MFPAVSVAQATVINTGHTYFFVNMSQLDLRARRAQTKQSYFDQYLSGISEFTEEQKKVLSQITVKANKHLSPYVNIYRMEWKIARVNGVEEGYPHTIGDTIFVSDAFFDEPPRSMVATMIHEKIHVFQKKFVLETNILVQKAWGYKMFGLRSNIPNARNNPDLNGVIYGKTSGVCQVYTTETPTSLKQSKVMCSGANADCEDYEHPLERMAYELSEILVGSYKLSTYEDNATMNWMRAFL